MTNELNKKVEELRRATQNYQQACALVRKVKEELNEAQDKRDETSEAVRAAEHALLNTALKGVRPPR